MKLAINIIGVFAVVIMTVLGIFLIPFLTWVTGFVNLHVILFIVSLSFLVISVLCFVISILNLKNKWFVTFKTFVDKFSYLRIILLYVSLGGFIPSLIFCDKIDFDNMYPKGELLRRYSSNYYYSKFGAFRMYANAEAINEYGEVFFIDFERPESKRFEDGEIWESVTYKIYDSYGDIISVGDYDFRYWYYRNNSFGREYEYAGDYYGWKSDVREAASIEEMKKIGLRIIDWEEW
uniref:hypothetical protein n=1 Tax=Alistipes sp. TaxID=1872444 RepID=UPI004056D15D